MTTFNWTISAVERAISSNGLQDVIKVVHWRYRGTNNSGVTVETYGITNVGDPNPEDFTPYNGVTESDVIGWLESILGEVLEGMGYDSQLVMMKKNIESQIELLVNPVMITGPLFSEPVVEELPLDTAIDSGILEELASEDVNNENG
jgi:hypothetical protein